MSDIYPIVVVPLPEDDGGGFVGYAPDLLGCMSDGETQEEATSNLRDAIDEWLLEAKELGREIPTPGSFAKLVQEEFDTLLELVEAQAKLVKHAEASKKKCRDLEAQVAVLKARLRAIEPVALHRALLRSGDDDDLVEHLKGKEELPTHVAAAALAGWRQ